MELLTVAFIEWDNYTGYRQTIVVVLCLGVIYWISRTQRVRLAALLAVIIAAMGVYFTGWADPRSVQGGLFDFMILPLWLGGLYLSLSGLSVLIVVSLSAILLFPLLAPQVTFNEVLVGPFSFVFVTSIMLLIITRHRNSLEQDRRKELTEKEERSRREAARAEALLRVADRLNAELDLDILLATICEEAANILNVPISIVAFHDPKQDVLIPSAGSGLPANAIKGLTPVSKQVYDQVMREMRSSSSDEVQKFAAVMGLEGRDEMNFRSLALASIIYEQDFIGALAAITQDETREFTRDELLLLNGMADQAALAITNTRLYKDAQRRLEHLQALRAIDIAISTNHDLQNALNVILDQITRQLQVDAAAILLLDQVKQRLEFVASRGFQTSTLRYTSLRMGEGLAGRAAQQRAIVHVRDLRIDPQTLASAASLAAEGFVSYYAAPLISQGQVKGVLEIFHRAELEENEEWLGFLETLAGQAAIAIESTSLFEDLQRSNEELSQAYDSTIEGWSRALDLRDKETEGHTRRVTDLTLELARAFGFSEVELVHIRRGGLLHDIGKMGVPDRILLKEGKLTDEEWEIMRRHPDYAHEMLRSIEYLRPALDIPYCHHEKWDGTGYPRSLKGEAIPLIARIFAIADVWDALTSDRPYRPAWPREKVLTYLQEQSGKHFDPRVVEVFTQLINKETNN